MSANIVVIENRRPALIGAIGFDMVPGENDVPVALWTAFKKTKFGKMLLKASWVRERRDLKKSTPLVENLNVVEVEKAVALVEGCKSDKLLRIWAKNDKRSKVQAAIMHRIDALAVPESPEDDDSAETEADTEKGSAASKG